MLNAWCVRRHRRHRAAPVPADDPRPGLSTGLYTNTRRVGAIVSGPIIAIGSLTVLGQRGIFLTCAALTLIGLVIIGLASLSSGATRATAAERGRDAPVP